MDFAAVFLFLVSLYALCGGGVSAIDVDTETKSVLQAALTRDINMNNNFDDSKNVPESLFSVDVAKKNTFVDYHDDVTGRDVYFTRHTLDFTTEGFAYYKFHYQTVYEKRGPDNMAPGVKLISMRKTGKSGGTYGTMASDPNNRRWMYWDLTSEILAHKAKELPHSSLPQLQHVYAVGTKRPTENEQYFAWVITCRSSIGETGKAYWKWFVKFDGYPDINTGTRGTLEFNSFISESSYVVGADSILAQPQVPSAQPIPVSQSAIPSLETLIVQSLGKWDYWRNVQPSLAGVISATQQDVLDYRVGGLFDVFATKYAVKFRAEFAPAIFQELSMSLYYATPLDGEPKLEISAQGDNMGPSYWKPVFNLEKSLNMPGRPPHDMATQAITLYNSDANNILKINNLNKVLFAARMNGDKLKPITPNYYALVVNVDTLAARGVTFKWILSTTGSLAIENYDRLCGKTGQLTALSIVYQTAHVRGVVINIPTVDLNIGAESRSWRKDRPVPQGTTYICDYIFN